MAFRSLSFGNDLRATSAPADGVRTARSSQVAFAPGARLAGNSPHTRDLRVTSVTKGGRAGRFCRNGQLMVRRIPCVGGFRPDGQLRHFHPRTSISFLFSPNKII